ncbi:hypothetical protein [Microbacterium sp. PAMC21962]|uniref:hypothetical protein n=1 Tax=Microbacterium sp. PAMC21962 TaxID=2861280 RepID=UPI001C6377C4|nr:hypothetical protein [Microbacterium sp. PAMC21962]QYF98106.1 hypothetical protein KY498_02295 [Microbacterium sp. PAMC21962]
MTIIAVPTPNITPLINIASEIRDLEARRSRLLAQLVADCEFMDTPIHRLDYFDVDDRETASTGDVFHVVECVRESGDDEWVDLHAHPAANCAREWCKPDATVKFPKYSHVGSRSFWTRQPDHILAGVEQESRESLLGKGRSGDVYTFVPVSIERAR